MQSVVKKLAIVGHRGTDILSVGQAGVSPADALIIRGRGRPLAPQA
jgi:hypothetical protein